MAHASSSKICKYDVFLSFRGEDTRRNFVSHLYNALEQRGIHAFKDDVRLEKGKSISDELLKATEEARFAIVIFSRKYASSRWCLEELAHIIKCKNELKQVVIPVFYDVSPSDVRHQNPPFAKSFSKHEKKYKGDMEKVQSWRDAFADAGKLSGYHLINYKDEADCIKKLVDDIFPKLLQVISSFPESLVGMESRVEKVASLLDMESNDVRSIGIWGMGGIGKTEIAKALYQRYRHRFEADCFLGDVGTLYQKNGLAWLAELVISKLLGEKMTLTSEHEGAIILKNMLRRKKVLFILDDVNHREQLELLVGGPERFGKGSRIILTARDKHLLISHVGDNVYEVELLSENEALELFSRHAFKEKPPKEDFKQLSREVVEYAGRLPLALKVLGSSFYGRDRKHWRYIIDQLKRIPDNDILGKLKLSFDGLNKHEKELFLDFAFLDITYLTRYDVFQWYIQLALESRGFQLLEVDYLIEKSLLSINFNKVVMHKMIRDMAVNVIREEYANSRIWLPEEVHDLFRGKLKTEKVESLCIPEYYVFEDNPVNYNNIFRRMQSLRVLIIDFGDFSSGCVITYLPSSLRFIEWGKYPSISLPESFEPSQLVVLCLQHSCLVEFWPTSKKLSNLKYLDLKGSLGLTKTPNFGDMPNLETLHLWGCSNLEEVHPSLGHCRKLTSLNLYGCLKLKKLPRFVTMESLECLNLLSCTSLEEFPEICGDMRRLSELRVGSPWIRSLPPSLTGLRQLELKDCEILAMLPNSLFESQQLEYLLIYGCSRLVELPVSLGVQKKLGLVNVNGCENLKKLPSSIKMESLPTLMIYNCPILDTFPEIKGDMHCLKKLILNTIGIRELPSSIGNLSGLIELSISDCPKLDTFPEINGDMHCLEELILNSTGIRELPSSIGNLRGLKSIYLNGCEDLVSLPDNICNLINLRHLYLRGCKTLEKLPENIDDLQELEALDARETAISQPPPSINKLVKLRELRFSHVQYYSTSVFLQLSGFSYLDNLQLNNLNILGGLPENLGSLQYLKSLDVSRSSISCLPKSIRELLHLWSLKIQFCENLSELPGELPPNLVELFADYHALTSIRDLVNKYPKLYLFSISWCDHEKFECQTVSSEQVNAMKFIQHFLRTCIQCDFNQQGSTVISFPEVRIPELFDYQFINQKKISINLNPSWYTDKFMGFSICCCPIDSSLELYCTLVCKSDTNEEHSLKRQIYGRFDTPVMCYIYTPFETFWHDSGNNEGKTPNDYYLFEVSEMYGKELCWGIRMEYENKDRRRRRKPTQSPKLFQVCRKDTSVTAKSGCSIVLEQPEPSSPSSSPASAEDDIATGKGLYLRYERKHLAVDQAETDGASRKRKRKRNRKKKRKMAGADGTCCSLCTN